MQHLSPQHIAARERHFACRLTGGKHAVNEDIEGLRIDGNLWARIVPQHVALRQPSCAADWKHFLGKAKFARQVARDRQRMHEARRQGRGALPNAPIADASGSLAGHQRGRTVTHCTHAMKPPLITSSGLMPKRPDAKHNIGELAVFQRADMA